MGAIIISNTQQQFPGRSSYTNVPQPGQEDNPLYISALGTPVFSNLHIDGGQYVNNAGQTIQYDELIVDTVLFNVQNTKNIIKTSIQGSDLGTVKEYIGLGDYVLGCSFIFGSGQINVHPWDMERRFNEIFKAPISLKIINTWLNGLGIHEIVITDAQIPQLPGEYSQLNVSFNALSDTPVILLFDRNGNPA